MYNLVDDMVKSFECKMMWLRFFKKKKKKKKQIQIFTNNILILFCLSYQNY